MKKSFVLPDGSTKHIDYEDAAISDCRVKFGFMDRIRILFGVTVYFTSQLWNSKELDILHAEQTVRVPDLFYFKKQQGGMTAPEIPAKVLES